MMKIHTYNSLESTNSEALRLASTEEPSPFAVFTHQQRAGRGRNQRHWESAAGNLTATWVFPTKISPTMAQLGVLVGVSACDLLRDLGCPAQLKWPNDLLVQNNKLGGMLSEYTPTPTGTGALAVGLGMNLHPVKDLDQPATSVQEWASSVPEALDLMHRLTERIDSAWTRYRQEGGTFLIHAWRERSSTLGQSVRIERTNDTVTGKAVDIAPDFSLLLHTESGLVSIHVGDCIHLRAAAL